jgi:hypothetical protein
MKILYAAILFLSFGPIAHAFIDTANRNVSYQQERNFPSVCKITIHFPSDTDDSETLGYCTGTLVGPDKIYTAAHCFRQTFDIAVNRVDVTCGGETMGKASQVKIPNAADWGSDVLSPEILQDFAVVSLVFRSHNAEAAVASGPELYFDPASGNLLPGVTCNAFGFGYTNLTNPPSFGKLTEATLQNDLIVSTPFHLIALTAKAGQTILETRFGEGDSGGPLFCQAPGHGIELVGVIDENDFPYGTNQDQTFRSILNAVYMHPQN